MLGFGGTYKDFCVHRSYTAFTNISINYCCTGNISLETAFHKVDAVTTNSTVVHLTLEALASDERTGAALGSNEPGVQFVCKMKFEFSSWEFMWYLSCVYAAGHGV